MRLRARTFPISVRPSWVLLCNARGAACWCRGTKATGTGFPAFAPPYALLIDPPVPVVRHMASVCASPAPPRPHRSCSFKTNLVRPPLRHTPLFLKRPPLMRPFPDASPCANSSFSHASFPRCVPLRHAPFQDNPPSSPLRHPPFPPCLASAGAAAILQCHCPGHAVLVIGCDRPQAAQLLAA